MLISVVVPTFNRADSLLQTLTALAQQTYRAREIIVVDDGSTDQTAIVAHQFQAEYIFQQNRGPAAARNAGICTARGEIVAFTDDDCMPSPTWLEQLRRGYLAHPHVAGVGGPCHAPREHLRANPYARYEWTFERVMLPSPSYIRWLTSGRLVWQNVWRGTGDYVGGMDCPAGRSNNISYKRNVLDALNCFDESFPFAAGEDADLKIRICLANHSLLWLDALAVEHRHAYTAERFRVQHIAYGRGVVCIERKFLEQPTPRWRAGLRLLKRVARFPFDLISSQDPQLARLRLLAGVYDAWGQMTFQDARG